MQIDVESTPSELVFTTEPPSSSSSGSTFNLAVSVEDPNGNVVGFSSALVTLTFWAERLEPLSTAALTRSTRSTGWRASVAP